MRGRTGILKIRRRCSLNESDWFNGTVLFKLNLLKQIFTSHMTDPVKMQRVSIVLITASLVLLLLPAFNRDSHILSQDSLIKVHSVQPPTVEKNQAGMPADSSVADSATGSNPHTAGKSTLQRTGQVLKYDIKKIFRTVFRYFRHCMVLIVCCGITLYTISFFRKKADNKRFLTSTRLSVMNKEVQVACNYMEKYYGNPDLSVESMCEALVTGPAFLEALFERELGMSVSDFLLQVRINRAKKILEKRPLEPADEVALQIGFVDCKLFLKNFKEITELSFEEYQSSISPKV